MKIGGSVESDKSTIAKKIGQTAFFAVYENKKDVSEIIGCDVIHV